MMSIRNYRNNRSPKLDPCGTPKITLSPHCGKQLFAREVAGNNLTKSNSDIIYPQADNCQFGERPFKFPYK